MNNRRLTLEQFSMEFDLKRIRKLELPEKFRMVNHVRLIGEESRRALKEGIPALAQSPYYTVNKTYNLFAMLLVTGLSDEVLEEIILNYAKNFENSDTYYAQIAILGMGVLMIQKKYPTESITNYLMSLFGDEFLLENLKFDGHMKAVDVDGFTLGAEILYKPFEGNSRNVKYDLLALLKIRETEGLEKVSDIIRNHFGNSRLAFYFNLMDVEAPEVRDVIYENMRETHLRDDKLRVCGAYAILTGRDIFSTHYVFNSIIGKYSRHDKDSGEIESEMNVHLAAIMEKVKG